MITSPNINETEPMVTISVPARYADAHREHLRKLGCSAAGFRATAVQAFSEGRFYDASHAALDAALHELPDPPTLTVGELAEYAPGVEWRVDFIGRKVVVCTDRTGSEVVSEAVDLTPLGFPAPDDWGQK